MCSGPLCWCLRPEVMLSRVTGAPVWSYLDDRTAWKFAVNPSRAIPMVTADVPCMGYHSSLDALLWTQ